VGPPNV
jgi:hypothetical protein